MSDFFISKNQSLENYLREIGEVQLLTPEEEIELAQRIKENDQRALKKLVSANLRFVVSVAKSYQNYGLSLEDLINEGNLGLMKAAYRFDETRGFKFISYAVWWIKQSILQAIAEQSRLVRLPLNRVGTLTKIGKVYSMLEQEYEREPTPEEIATVLEVDSGDITDTIKMATRSVSMDSPLQKNSDSRLIDIIQNQQDPEPDSEVMGESLKEEVNHILSTLTAREAKILKLYFGLDGEKPPTLEEIGVKFKLTRERVRQIKEKALRRLRHSSRSKVLRYYLG
ncbi:MAG: sigma-70 family RNA polymerase sigma factor [Calditrichaceae bacterium]|nr:sigma-70 family RNA polymerase sigma factor [Calditrichaceae bacterium]RQV94259.1 MAG: sigma-70 family RNA polymerase sigma factor [Calditrichota bacterium]